MDRLSVYLDAGPKWVFACALDWPGWAGPAGARGNEAATEEPLSAPDGPPIEVVHKGCGELTEAQLVCSCCGEPITGRDVAAHESSGARGALLPARR